MKVCSALFEFSVAPPLVEVLALTELVGAVANPVLGSPWMFIAFPPCCWSINSAFDNHLHVNIKS
jgi:hypothetical protein